MKCFTAPPFRTANATFYSSYDEHTGDVYGLVGFVGDWFCRHYNTKYVDKKVSFKLPSRWMVV